MSPEFPPAQHSLSLTNRPETEDCFEAFAAQDVQESAPDHSVTQLLLSEASDLSISPLFIPQLAHSVSMTAACNGSPPLSRRSSVSSISTIGKEDRPSQPPTPHAATAASSQPPAVRADPLSRQYPKPAQDIDVAEALARPPLRWSLGHWTKHAKDLRTPGESSEARVKKLEEAKRELVRMAQSKAVKR